LLYIIIKFTHNYLDNIFSGNHVLKAGNEIKMISNKISITTNQNTPLKATDVFSPAALDATKTFIPTGGVTNPISAALVTIIPNQIGLNPNAMIIGKVKGNVNIKIAI